MLNNTDTIKHQISNRFKNQRLSAQIIEYNKNPDNIFELKSRQCHCLSTISNHVVNPSMFKNKESIRAYLKGLQTCGSVWNCPVCAVKISEYRKNELEQLIDQAHIAGKYIYMFTWTLPHYAHESCKTVLDRFTQTTKQMKRQKKLKKSPNFKPWKELLSYYDNQGYVITKENLWGINGFHIHSHGLFIFNKKIENQLQARDHFFEVWLKACDLNFKIADYPEHIFKAFVKRSFRLDHLSGDASKIVSEYFTKSGVLKIKEKDLKDWKLQHEMTKGHLKKSESGLLTPFGMLDFIRVCEDKKIANFMKQKYFEYTQAFKGQSFVRWSPGLRKQYNIEEKTDQEIVEESNILDKLYGILPRKLWKKIVRYKLRAWLIINSEMDFKTLIKKLKVKIQEREDLNFKKKEHIYE